MIRAPVLTLGIALTLAGIAFGIFVYWVDAPYVWGMGFVAASYGIWLIRQASTRHHADFEGHHETDSSSS